jgi:hypothetical protein
MRQIVWTFLAVGLISTPAFADDTTSPLPLTLQVQSATAVAVAPSAVQAAAPAAPSPKTIVTGAIDVPSLYMFRGIRQEGDPKLTVQPWVNVAFVASDKVTVNVGSWNSLHTGSTKDAFGAYYETDFIASAAIATGTKVNPTIQYTAYTSPDNGFLTVHEVAFIAAIDDSKSAHPFAPTITLGFNHGKDGAVNGVDNGIYLELGVNPAIPMKKDSKVSLNVPVKLGLSAKDYYYGDTFGYLSAGLSVLGKFSDHLDLHGSVVVYTLGDMLKAANLGNKSEVVGTVGLGFSFSN